MNRAETNRVLAFITAVYPLFLKERDPELLCEVWQGIFASVPFAQVLRAVNAYIATDTRGFPPTPGSVNAFLVKTRQLNERTEDEAWALALKAASRSGYNCGEEFAKLPPEIQEIVGSANVLHEWAMMSTSDVNTVVAAGFKRSYRARQELRRELGNFALPPQEQPLLSSGAEAEKTLDAYCETGSSAIE